MPRLLEIVALSELFAGGPGSGCNPAVGECGRKPGADTDQPFLEPEPRPTTAPYMRLWLKTNETPFLFPNDGTMTWSYNADKSVLHIEELDSDLKNHPADYSEKSVYDVPVKNIHQWIPATGQNMAHFGFRAAGLRAFAVSKRRGGNRKSR